ncbi:MAG: hypothetical protein II879_02770, partial [Clostridia bacterium]|nr:hypothetical protein [Clostridia bacterium]
MLKRILSLGLALMLTILSAAVLADDTDLYDESTAYILNPPTLPEEPATKHEFINVLMVGVDYGILTSGRGKEDIKNCHTDSVIMAAFDMTAGKVNLISIPRDTLTYVPGVHGVYK